MSNSKCNLNARTVAAAKPADKPYELRDIKTVGFLLRVQPSGVMSFVAEFRPGKGRRKKRVTVGQSPVWTVERARRRAVAIMAHGGRLPTQGREVLTLREFIEDHYGPYCREHNQSGAAILARLRACFEDDFYDRLLTDITTGLVESWRVKRQRAGRKSSTINRDTGALRAVLSRAVDWGHVSVDPLHRLKPLKIDKQHIVRYLNPAEDKRLRKALKTAPDYLRAMVIVSLNTGLRRGELFTLKWSAIDLKRRQLSVVGSLSKTGQTRHIALNQHAIDALREWRDISGNADGLVFVSHATGGVFNNTKKSWAALLERAKIKNFRWHDLRHDFASKLVMSGADLYGVSKLLGHSSVETTQRYAHLAPDHLADLVARLDR